MPAEEKLRWADYIIDTSDALEETIAQTERVYAKLLEDVEVKRRKKAPSRAGRKAEVA
jgi:dephospho-CoA kinase